MSKWLDHHAQVAWIFVLKYKTALKTASAAMLIAAVTLILFLNHVAIYPKVDFWFFAFFVFEAILLAVGTYATISEAKRDHLMYPRTMVALRSSLLSMGVETPVAVIRTNPKALDEARDLYQELETDMRQLYSDTEIMDIAALPLSGRVQIDSAKLVRHAVMERKIVGLSNVVEVVKAMESANAALQEGAL